MLVDDLLEALRRSGDEAHEAGLALGLLIEQERVRRPCGDDGGMAAILGKGMADRRLSEQEVEAAVDGLIAHLGEHPWPHPMAVWALTKSYEARALTPLVDLLQRTMSDPDQEPLAYQALVGVLNIGMAANRDLAISLVQRVAEEGHGSVKETAARYLETSRGHSEG